MRQGCDALCTLLSRRPPPGRQAGNRITLPHHTPLPFPIAAMHEQSEPASTLWHPPAVRFEHLLLAVCAAGSPGLGPISLRREIVVFKDGFRSRQYCLSECAQVCKLISDSEQQQQQQQKQP